MNDLRQPDNNGRISIGQRLLKQIAFDPQKDVFEIKVTGENEILLERHSIGKGKESK